MGLPKKPASLKTRPHVRDCVYSNDGWGAREGRTTSHKAERPRSKENGKGILFPDPEQCWIRVPTTLSEDTRRQPVGRQRAAR